MRGIEVAQRAEGFEDRGREREREGAEILAGRPAEDEGFAVDGLAVGEAVDGELAPGRVLEELEERAALLLDEGEEDGGGDFGAGGPERVQLGEERRVGEGERGGVVGEANREAQRVGGQQRACVFGTGGTGVCGGERRGREPLRASGGVRRAEAKIRIVFPKKRAAPSRLSAP